MNINEGIVRGVNFMNIQTANEHFLQSLAWKDRLTCW